ncbi:hypothetical protein D3C76_1845890 [compost metagenome]
MWLVRQHDADLSSPVIPASKTDGCIYRFPSQVFRQVFGDVGFIDYVVDLLERLSGVSDQNRNEI